MVFFPFSLNSCFCKMFAFFGHHLFFQWAFFCVFFFNLPIFVAHFFQLSLLELQFHLVFFVTFTSILFLGFRFFFFAVNCSFRFFSFVFLVWVFFFVILWVWFPVIGTVAAVPFFHFLQVYFVCCNKRKLFFFSLEMSSGHKALCQFFKIWKI